MQLKELSRVSGVSVASIKFYLREDLLKPGEPGSANRAEYTQEHLDRLELIRLLRQVVGLGLDKIKTLTSAVDNPGVDVINLLGLTQATVLGLPEEAVPDHRWTAELMSGGRWLDAPSPARNSLNELFGQMEEFGMAPDATVLSAYAAAVDQVAALDIGHVEEQSTRGQMVRTVAMGTFLYSKLLLRMLALAQTSRAMQRFPGRGDGGPAATDAGDPPANDDGGGTTRSGN
ncbi:MAG TPA: MerR family transcriptional regulator [Arthrobacter sp.]|nr:MerR family transcriptional regulator [Arthrobacter sp.]